MPRVTRIGIVALFASAVLLSSCDQMFNSNLFMELGLGQEAVAATPEAVAALEVTQIAGVVQSPAAIDKLSNLADPAIVELRQAYIDALVTKAAEATTPAAKQEALVLAVELEVKTTLAGSVANDALSNLGEIQTLAADPSATTAEILAAAIPAIDFTATDPVELAAAKADFTQLVESLQSAADILSILDTSIGANAGAFVESGETGYAIEDIAQVAVLAFFVDAIVPTDSGQTTAEALWDFVSTGDSSVVTIPDLDPSALGGDNILAAANFDIATLLASFSSGGVE